MTPDEGPAIPGIPTDRPTSARAYDWMLGGKDNYEVDRDMIRAGLPRFPEGVDITRQNRLFLYRAVRYLAHEAGIRQFIDMGCGLPTNNNVHQVAQEFDESTHVVYVDIDPIVLAHGRALLADDDSTVVITADMRDQEVVLGHPDLQRLIDFNEPLAILFLSVPHHLVDADDPRTILRTVIDRAASGSYLALSQVVTDDEEHARVTSEYMNNNRVPWQTRTPQQVDAFTDGLEPVSPGMVNLAEWRPDPSQPPLPPVPPELKEYVGITKESNRLYEYGGLLRKP
ncbi:SAM-dependent methyltransferase [Streptomyces sp. NBC_01808]|uniref:SAM-dependent methyltransferase n=1 Tax=Streptomyces sp. NBC_01808 TaxID=2975947 RepID=UPI002DD8FB54|nr:SAM-dependent methyltransferase [Streptomyces sp. NBC_01808]WSA40378.1 SAM-dependent methyltransferase [Streptomyces sp. NBC_01808]